MTLCAGKGWTPTVRRTLIIVAAMEMLVPVTMVRSARHGLVDN